MKIDARRYAKITRAALWSLAIIVVTGAAVRLTGSGLGCSDWPTCEENQFVADLEYHALIEFGNRLFTGVVSLAVVVAVLAALRRKPYRRDLVNWSWGLVAGVVAQIILGAILVRSELDPRFTLGHFLLSMILIWNATVLDVRAKSENQPRPRLIDSTVQRLIKAIAASSILLIVSGTIVTGTGPHGGDEEVERLPFLVRDVTRLHSSVAIAVVILVAVAAQLARRRHQPDDIVRRLTGVGALLIAQGVLGYTQYFTGVPVVLVAIHIAVATLVWTMIVRLELALRHDPQLTPAPKVPSAVAL